MSRDLALLGVECIEDRVGSLLAIAFPLFEAPLTRAIDRLLAALF